MKKSVFVILFLLVVPIVFSLEISEIAVYVNGDKDIVRDKGTIYDVQPDSDVKLRITVDNEKSTEVEDVKIKAVIYDIDDHDDLDDETSHFDIEGHDDKTKTLEFEVPLEVESGTYRLAITAESNYGETDSATLNLELDKNSHDVRVFQLSLSPERVRCKRNFYLSFKVINVGEDNEDVVLTVNNEQLEINDVHKFWLSKSVGDDDNEKRKMYSYSLNGARPGDYIINVNLQYKTKLQTYKVPLRIEKCTKEYSIDGEVEYLKAYRIDDENVPPEVTSFVTKTVTKEKTDNTLTLLVVSGLLGFIVVVFLLMWLLKN